jgi:hypothetical protein
LMVSTRMPVAASNSYSKLSKVGAMGVGEVVE